MIKTLFKDGEFEFLVREVLISSGSLKIYGPPISRTQKTPIAHMAKWRGEPECSARRLGLGMARDQYAVDAWKRKHS